MTVNKGHSVSVNVVEGTVEVKYPDEEIRMYWVGTGGLEKQDVVTKRV